MHWLKKLNAHVRFREPLDIHTTLGIGGPAQAWVEPQDSGALKKIVCHCRKEKISYLVIGRGSNILVSDQGLRKLVICLTSPSFTKMEIRGKRISLGAGLTVHRLLQETQKQGLAGLEFLAGIPATIGGALVMNAGGTNGRIGSFIQSVTVMDKEGRIRLLAKKDLRFAYRKSNLDKYIVLKAVVNLTKKSPAEIKEQIKQNLLQKRTTQDLSAKSAGCIFKNPIHPLTAGQMLEACGLKGRRRGQAEISRRHANYIINRNGAKAKDVLFLMNLAQKQVKRKFGVELEPEIKILK